MLSKMIPSYISMVDYHHAIKNRQWWWILSYGSYGIILFSRIDFRVFFRLRCERSSLGYQLMSIIDHRLNLGLHVTSKATEFRPLYCIRKVAKRTRKNKLKPNDVKNLLCSFPKIGQTWKISGGTTFDEQISIFFKLWRDC